MYLKEAYYFFRMTHDLIQNQKFNLLHIDHSREEIWLEKKVKGITHIVRLLQEQFDWSNHLKRDIDETVERAKKLQRIIIGGKTFIHNVYVSTYPPVDQLELAKKTMEMERKLAKMRVYLLDEANRESKKEQLYNNLGLANNPFEYPHTELELEHTTIVLREQINQLFVKSQKEKEAVFQNGMPFFTFFLIIINVFMFFLLEGAGGSTSTNTLIEYGAKYNPAILDGEWWRIISSMFLHIGALHLIMNMIALHFLGSVVENIYGNFRFLVIYFLAGIMGGLSSFALNPHIAAGASGAIFGLFGALLFFGINYKKIFFQTMGWNVIVVICINIVFGFSVPQIDNGAHIGGLIGGFVASSIVFFPRRNNWYIQLISLPVYVVMIGSLLLYGIYQFSNHENSALQLQIAQELINEEQYEEVIEKTSNGITIKGENIHLAELLFFRSFAHIKLNQPGPAMDDLEQAIKIKGDFPEAHYNLALLLTDINEIERATHHAKEATKLAPGNEEFSDLYKRLQAN
ncbi:rhomboid family intramembrane serine protease [Aquibacillus albus]|uniref:Rhomboid protease GluP n=1 Tax=Aquibacillus albus TaxID=1168171 RepID=A0ABS2MUZ7_9BACI|nr:rhomboid family intramembrane serine protease [Aquibacillus albus]MBM7569667.1 rhomboid protease GluP [Aquibacillus albus]